MEHSGKFIVSRRSLRVLLLATCVLPAAAQDAVDMQPHSFKVAFENDRMRVLEYNSRPGMGACGEGMHTHPAHLTVIVKGGKLRVKMPDGKTMNSNIDDGAVFWTEADIPHEIENISGRNMRSLLIELKDPPRGAAKAK
jgi:hypothetical protein